MQWNLLTNSPSPPCGIAGKCNSQETFQQLEGGGGHYKYSILYFFEEIFITVGPWLMKLYTTPPSILTLLTWVPNPTVCSLACGWRIHSIESGPLLDSKALSHSSELSYSAAVRYALRPEVSNPSGSIVSTMFC